MQPYTFPQLAHDTVHATRQAICNAAGETVAFELLDAEFPVQMDLPGSNRRKATTRALGSVALGLGWKHFFEHRPAFIRVDLEYIENTLQATVPPAACVLEIAPLSRADWARAAVLDSVRQGGWRLAWDGVEHAADPRLALARPGDFIKIDGQAVPPAQLHVLLDRCGVDGLRPVLARLDFGAIPETLRRDADTWMQGRLIARPETRSRVRIPQPPRAALLLLRESLRSNGPIGPRTKLLEHTPELLFALLMLTDVAWPQQRAYPDRVEELLQGLPQDALLAWIDVMLRHRDETPDARDLDWGLTFLRPALFGRLLAEPIEGADGDLTDVGFMVGFVAQVLASYPGLLLGTDAAIHVGPRVEGALAWRTSPLHDVFSYVSQGSAASAMGQAEPLGLPRAVKAQFARSAAYARHLLAQPPRPEGAAGGGVPGQRA